MKAKEPIRRLALISWGITIAILTVVMSLLMNDVMQGLIFGAIAIPTIFVFDYFVLPELQLIT